MTAGSAPLCRRCGVVVGHRPIRGQGVNAQLDCGPFPAVVLRRMPRIKQDTKIEALKNSPLFEGLSRKQLTNIARLTDDLDVPAGTVLCEQGRRGHEFFCVRQGKSAHQHSPLRQDLANREHRGALILKQVLRRIDPFAAPLRDPRDGGMEWGYGWHEAA